MRTIALLLLSLLSVEAGQQTLWWNMSGSSNVVAYEFRFGTNSGNYQVTNVVNGRSTTNATFTLPAGKWFAQGWSLTASNGVSDPSNEVSFDIPQPITIRLNLSSAETLEGPWKDETNTPPIEIVTTDPQRFYRARVEITSP